MSMTFTKLFSSITESTIWCEPSEIRIVWITMLAMSDREGRIWGSIPGLANRAQVSVESVEKALEKFQSPDKYSRTTDFEGRRIEVIDGGWRLLNHGKYRAIRDSEERKAYKREWIKDKRNKDNGVDNVDQSRPQYTHTDTDTEAKIKTLEQSFKAFWSMYPKKRNIEQARKAWKKLNPDTELVETITSAVEKAKQTEDWRKEKGKYIPYPSTWLNAKGWLDEYEVSVETMEPKPTGKLARAVEAIKAHHAEANSDRTITQDAGQTAGLLPGGGRATPSN